MSDGRCWLAATEFVPIEAWNVVSRSPAAVNTMLDVFRDAAVKSFPAAWNADIKAHHGPVHETENGLGVVFVLRAWRKAPTDSGMCDGTCEMCSSGRQSFVMTGVAP